MKKQLLAIMMAMALLLAACSSTEDSKGKDEKNKEDATNTEETSGAVAVDKGLLNVEVTIPATFLEGEDLDTVVAEAKEEGIKDVTKNADGSVTYKMTKAKHKEMMEEMRVNVTQYVDELISDENFASIQDIEYNKDFSEFTMTVDKAAFENSFDAFATLGLAMSGMFYQLYDGVKSDKLNVKLDLKDQATGEIFESIEYPEALENME